jgi:SAM-dependent methyltransferase
MKNLGERVSVLRPDPGEVEWAKEILEQSWAYRAARALQAAHAVGIFEKLAETEEDDAGIATALHLDPDVTSRLLVACAAMGFLERDESSWRLSAKARATLVSSALLYQGNNIAHSAEVWRFWNDLEPALKGKRGLSIFTPGARRERSHRDFILAMHNMTMAGRGAELASRVDLAGKRKLLDIGGGPGTYSAALCEKYPHLMATVFDLPETVKIAREVLARLGLGSRIDFREGDWEIDDFGSGADVVLMSNILHGPGSNSEMKLAKAFKVLKAGGVLILQDFLLNEEKTGPLKPALFNLMVGAYSVKELRGLIESAGFSLFREDPLPDDVGTTLLQARRER